MSLPLYEWTVVLRNDTMGFTKTFHVRGFDYIRAASNAYLLLGEKLYNVYDFEVMEMKRGREVGT